MLEDVEVWLTGCPFVHMCRVRELTTAKVGTLLRISGQVVRTHPVHSELVSSQSDTRGRWMLLIRSIHLPRVSDCDETSSEWTGCVRTTWPLIRSSVPTLAVVSSRTLHMCTKGQPVNHTSTSSNMAYTGKSPTAQNIFQPPYIDSYQYTNL